MFDIGTTYNGINAQKANTLIADEMVKRGITPNTSTLHPIAPMKSPFKERPKARDLTTEDMFKIFTRREALEIVYIPHFITHCIIYYIEIMYELCRTNKISDWTKQIKTLNRLQKDYFNAISRDMPPEIFKNFESLRHEYLELCGVNLSKMYFTFANEILKKYGHVENAEIICYANIIKALAEYVESFDRKVNARIAERMGLPCSNGGDMRLKQMWLQCRDIVSRYPLTKNNQTEICVKVMANNAYAMITEILNN